MSVNQMSSPQLPFDQMSVNLMSFDQMSVNHMLFGQRCGNTAIFRVQISYKNLIKYCYLTAQLGIL